MTNDQLSELIVAATAQLCLRASGQKTVWQSAPQQTVEYKTSPGDTDLHFLTAVLALVKSGGLIRAAEKDQYSEIVKRYEDWATDKKYPKGLRGSGSEWFKKYGRI